MEGRGGGKRGGEQVNGERGRGREKAERRKCQEGENEKMENNLSSLVSYETIWTNLMPLSFMMLVRT